MLNKNRQEEFIKKDYEEKIDQLISKMTLGEKIGQLIQISPSLFGAFGMTPDEIIEKLVNGEITPEEFENLERNYHEDEIRQGLIGSMGGVNGAEKSNELQRIAVEESRLGIPVIFGLDVIHGYRTVFPIPLAEACSWEPELMKESARIAAKEASAAGVHWTFAPMVDISRDPRWGRVAEGAGEDPYLGSVIAAARVEGFQGGDLSSPESILACAKHFAAYGAPEGGRDYNTVDMSLQMLHDVYLPPFKAAAQAGAATFMSAFNDINGVPCTTNKYLLTHVLREMFGFNGFVVSDANSVAECAIHGHAADRKEASKKAIESGLDMDMSHGTFREDLPEQFNAKKISEEVLNEAVRRVLRVKFLMGLFDNPYRTDKEKEEKTILCSEHIKAAREVARRSIVLLKNENNTLPLKKDLKKIAVVGPLADSAEDMLGTWAIVGRSEDAVPVVDGIKSAVSSETEVVYSKGCDLDGDKEYFEDAIEATSGSDVIIAVVGESVSMSGEAASRIDLTLPGRQEELLKELRKTGKPLVVVLINGRPLSIPWVSESATSIVEAWQLGIQSGNALADVLFGDYNPSGKLVSTFPNSVGQVPVYYNHPMTGRPAGQIKFTSKYIDGPHEPLYPFGFGLSYTTFNYESLVLSSNEVLKDGKLTVSVNVTNTGSKFGEEIVQLYVTDVVGSRVRPIKELKGFKKVSLNPGQCKTVSIDVNISELGFHDENMNYVVEPGLFKVCVGPNSKEGLDGEFKVIQ